MTTPHASHESNDSIEALCNHCGQTFSTFLHQMANKNAEVVCPRCRESNNCTSVKDEQAVARKI
jgi:phage FluMu protein Com